MVLTKKIFQACSLTKTKAWQTRQNLNQSKGTRTAAVQPTIHVRQLRRPRFLAVPGAPQLSNPKLSPYFHPLRWGGCKSNQKKTNLTLQCPWCDKWRQLFEQSTLSHALKPRWGTMVGAVVTAGTGAPGWWRGGDYFLSIRLPPGLNVGQDWLTLTVIWKATILSTLCKLSFCI